MIIYVQIHTYNHRKCSDYLTYCSTYSFWHLYLHQHCCNHPHGVRISFYQTRIRLKYQKATRLTGIFPTFYNIHLLKRTRVWPYLFIANMGHFCRNWGLKKLEDVPWVWIDWIGLDAGEVTWNLQTTLRNGDGNWGCLYSFFIVVSNYICQPFIWNNKHLYILYIIFPLRVYTYFRVNLYIYWCTMVTHHFGLRAATSAWCRCMNCRRHAPRS